MFWPAIRTYATALAYVKGLDGGNPLNQQMAQLLGNQAQNKLAAAEEALDADGEVDLKSEIKAQNIFLNTNIAFAYVLDLRLFVFFIFPILRLPQSVLDDGF